MDQRGTGVRSCGTDVGRPIIPKHNERKIQTREAQARPSRNPCGEDRRNAGRNSKGYVCHCEGTGSVKEDYSEEVENANLKYDLDMEILLLIAILGFVPAIIAKNKGRSFLTWYIYGTLLFIVAIIHALVIEEKTPAVNTRLVKNCPFCSEVIKKQSLICRFCGKEASFPLHEAVMDGEMEQVKQLLSLYDVNTKDPLGRTPLHFAAWKGHAAITKLLINRGAYVEEKTNQGTTPLSMATKKRYDNIVVILHKNGALK